MDIAFIIIIIIIWYFGEMVVIIDVQWKFKIWQESYLPAMIVITKQTDIKSITLQLDLDIISIKYNRNLEHMFILIGHI